MCVCMCVYVRACVCAYVRACVHVWVRVSFCQKRNVCICFSVCQKYSLFSRQILFLHLKKGYELIKLMSVLSFPVFRSISLKYSDTIKDLLILFSSFLWLMIQFHQQCFINKLRLISLPTHNTTRLLTVNNPLLVSPQGCSISKISSNKLSLIHHRRRIFHLVCWHLWSILVDMYFTRIHLQYKMDHVISWVVKWLI